MTGDLGVVAGVVRDAPELMHFLTEQSIAYGGAVRRGRAARHVRGARARAVVGAPRGGAGRSPRGGGRDRIVVRAPQPDGLRPADGRPPRRRRLRQDDREAGARHGRLPAPDVVAVPDHLGGRVRGSAAPLRERVPGAAGLRDRRLARLLLRLAGRAGRPPRAPTTTWARSRSSTRCTTSRPGGRAIARPSDAQPPAGSDAGRSAPAGRRTSASGSTEPTTG